jgi:8-oxo-dGTP diphosphatase
MNTTTIALVLNHEQDAFLMGYHQRGEGKGKLNFIGGKVADKPEFANETPEESVRREVMEESGLAPLSLAHCADIIYNYPAPLEHKSELMKVYWVESYSGKEKENSEEFKLIWVDKNNLPFDRMWESDKLWLPKVLGSTSYQRIDFYFDTEGTLILS